MKNTFVYILQLTPTFQNSDNWNDDTHRIVGTHFLYLQDLFHQNKVLFVGRTDYDSSHPNLQGWVVLNTDNEAEARQLMQQDPCVAQRVMEANLHPFHAVFYHSKD